MCSQKLLIFIAFMTLAYNCEARRFSRCELVRELRRQNFPNSQLRDWVCLIESESGRLTSAVGQLESDGSRGYGLFQIRDNHWCNNKSTPGKGCNVKCSDLLTDDITKASNCAKTIYRRHKFQMWDGWRIRCRGSLPDISSC